MISDDAARLAEDTVKVADQWDGRFFADGERGDLAYISADCDARQCDCIVNLNSDGDQDCSTSLGVLDGVDDCHEHIAELINAAGPLARALLALRAEAEAMRAVCGAASKWRASVQKFPYAPAEHERPLVDAVDSLDDDYCRPAGAQRKDAP